MTDWAAHQPTTDQDEANDQYDEANAHDDRDQDNDGDQDIEGDLYDDSNSEGDQTGADDLAAALAEIDAQAGRPPSEQVAAYADAHQALQATLSRIDAG